MPHLRPPRRRAATASNTANGIAVTTEEEVPVVDIRTTPSIWTNTTMLANAAALVVVGLAALAFLGIAMNVLVLGVGVVNPAWQTYKTLELDDIDSDDESEVGSNDENRDYIPVSVQRANWASYWVLASVLYVVIQLISLPAAFITLPQPLIPAVLVPTLLYLTRGGANNSRRIYDDVARPLLNSVRDSVDSSIDTAVGHVEYLASVALVQFYAAVRPYTASLHRAAATALRTIEQGQHVETPRRGRRRRSIRKEIG